MGVLDALLVESTKENENDEKRRSCQRLTSQSGKDKITEALANDAVVTRSAATP